MNTNSENPKVRERFQKNVKSWFESNTNFTYELEFPIKIGTPAKPHKFDISDKSGSIVVKCKCYMWTDTGNIPSAKMRGVNEAVFYFSFLPEKTKKIIVMAKAINPKRSETLAEYYYRTNGHLIGDVVIMEFDEATNQMRMVGHN